MLKNKVVLITGGSSGIGAATAELFAKEGATITIVGRNETNLKEVSQRCTAYGSEVHIIKADVSKDDEVDTIVKKTVDKFGKLDVLINNAGILRESNILSDNFLDTFDEVMNVNLRSPTRITKHAAPYLIETKGNIVNVSSITATTTSRPDNIAYRTSKAAMNHFTRTCAYELAKYGVRVNAVSPGPVVTNIFDGTSLKMDVLKARTALQRVSESGEIADMILYLASDKAKGITGANNLIDNGTTLM